MLTIEIEGSSRYRGVFMLRYRGIPEATCIVVDVLEDVAVLVAGFHANNYCIATFDIVK
jgi:hypothetical protein